MKSGLLNRIKGVYAPVKPPKGSEDTGQKTPGGQTIFRRRVQPRKKVRATDENGNPKFVGRNPMTGEGGTPVFKHVRDGGPRWEYFVINQGRHGNNRKVVVDPEALEAEQKREDAQVEKDRMLTALAERAVEKGMSVRETVDRILGLGQSEPEVPETGDSTEPALAEADGEAEGQAD